MIGWPEGLTDEALKSFTPFLIGLILDIVALPAPSAGYAAAAAAAEKIEEEKDEKKEKYRSREVVEEASSFSFFISTSCETK